MNSALRSNDHSGHPSNKRFWNSIGVILFVMIGWDSAFAETFPGFETEKWERLIQHAGQAGEPQETYEGIYQVLKKITPPNQAESHVAEYFSVVGGFDEQHVFHGYKIEVVSEVWTLDEKQNWTIEQWAFTLSMDGRIKRFLHAKFVKDKDNFVLDYQNIPSTDDEVLAAWSLRYQLWVDELPARARLQ